jgi:phosphoribosylanthranilate isomerase
MTRVKICGNKSTSDVKAAVKAGADALGFITDVPVETHRNLGLNESKELISKVPPFVETVAVTMPQKSDEAIKIGQKTGADTLQIHSDLQPDELRRIKEKTNSKLVKKISNELEDAKKFEKVSDALLIDSTGKDGRGGTGEEVDSDKAADIVEEVEAPVILAGGLTPKNVADRIETLKPYAVDVASGVEEEGTRSSKMVEDFVSEVKRC